MDQDAINRDRHPSGMKNNPWYTEVYEALKQAFALVGGVILARIEPEKPPSTRTLALLVKAIGTRLSVKFEAPWA